MAGPGEKDGGFDDLDAEFEAMMRGAGLDETAVPAAPEPAEDPSGGATGGEGADDDASDDDIAAALQQMLGEEDALTVLVTPVVPAEPVAGALRLTEPLLVDGRTVELPTGVVVLPQRDATLLACVTDAHSAEDLAILVSSMLQRLPVVVFRRGSDRMTARRYTSGVAGEEVTPALVLGACPDLAEELLLGQTDLDEVEQRIDLDALSEDDARRLMTRGKRRWFR
jgi:hypothetical protein